MIPRCRPANSSVRSARARRPSTPSISVGQVRVSSPVGGRVRVALVADHAVDQPGVQARPPPRPWWAARAARMKTSVGPFTTSPGDVGADGDHGRASEAAIASRMPGIARIGPIEITGLEGPIRIASALAGSPARASGVGVASAMPSSSTPSTAGLAVLGDQVLLQAAPALRGPHAGPHRLLAHRQHRAPAPRGRARSGPGRRCGCRPRRRSAAVQAGREVAVGELEPVRGAELDADGRTRP